MMDLDLNQIEKRLKTNLETVPDIDLAILFGSALRGKLRRDSDIDLAFYSNRTITLKERLQYSILLSCKLSLDINLIDLHNAHGYY
ncbi:MAG: nucleotidyltransferase domain-containing protein [Proteobacteria bacterium]|nr:nucleotidyltransferase domain-containing protein [Pseudomonadota bacterium]